MPTGKKRFLWLPGGARSLVIYGVIALFCFFAFQQIDINHTAGSSYALLDGHISDFYGHNAKIFIANNYLISTYIVFAVWNSPLHILGLSGEPGMDAGWRVFWYKLLPVLFLFASMLVLVRIGRTAGFGDALSKSLGVMWIFSPVLFFSQFIFGQYDVITVFFTLLGLLFYLERRILFFVLAFGVAATFKYFPLLLFLPMLLYVEKRLSRIAGWFFLALLPVAVEMLVYAFSPEFRTGVLGFSAVSRIFSAGIGIGSGTSISLFFAAWLVLCGIAYWRDPEEKTFLQWALYFPMAVAVLMFSLVLWHPQWLLFATPFMLLTTAISVKPEFFFRLDFLFMLGLVGFTVIQFEGNVDQSMIVNGAFGGMNPYADDPVNAFNMSKMLPKKYKDLFYTLVSVVFFVHIVFKFPLLRQVGLASVDRIQASWKTVRRVFLAGVMIFILPAIAAFLFSGTSVPVYSLAGKPGLHPKDSVVVNHENPARQVFRAKSATIQSVTVRVSRSVRYDVPVTLKMSLGEQIGDGEQRVLQSTSKDGIKQLNGNTYLIFKFDNLQVIPGKEYWFDLSLEGQGTEKYEVALSTVASGSSETRLLSDISGRTSLAFNLHEKVAR